MKVIKSIVSPLVLFLSFLSCICVVTGYDSTQISSYEPAQQSQAAEPLPASYAPLQQSQAAEPLPASYVPIPNRNISRYTPVCHQGYHLENGQCVPDQPVACLQGYHWENSQCVPDQSVACLQGYHLENGQCVPDQPVACLQGYHWENSQCVPDQSVACPQGYHFENGQCVPDQSVACPQGYHWENGQCVPDYGPDKTISCVSSGGTVKTRMCCGSTGDFPNTCLIGACGCSPENSKETKVCDCGPGKCFDGTSCVDIPTDDNGECNAGVLIQGQIVSISNPCRDFQSGSACSFEVRIDKVLKGNFLNVVSGETIAIHYTSGRKKLDVQVGDCVEVCAAWDTDLNCGDDLGYIKKIACSQEPTCIPGPTGRTRCVDDTIQEEYQNSDCSIEWRTIDDCSSHNPPCRCVDGKCISEYNIKIKPECSILAGMKLNDEPANWWYFLNDITNPPPSMYYVPQTITAAVCVNHNIPTQEKSDAAIAISFQIMVNEEDPNLVATRAKSVHPDPVSNQLCFGGRCGSNSRSDELQIHLKEPVIKSWYDALIKVYYRVNYDGDPKPTIDELNKDWVLAQELRIPNAFRILDDKSAGA